jgi:hypothetical protein
MRAIKGEAPSGGHVPHVGGSGSFSKGGRVGMDIPLISERPESLHRPGTKNYYRSRLVSVSEGRSCTLSSFLCRPHEPARNRAELDAVWARLRDQSAASGACIHNWLLKNHTQGAAGGNRFFLTWAVRRRNADHGRYQITSLPDRRWPPGGPAP